MADISQDRSLVDLFSAILREVTQIFRSETRLLRAEINGKINDITGSGMLIGAGAVALLAALFMLLHAIVRWLAVAGLPDQWGYLIVGLVVGAVGVGVLMSGVNRIKQTTLVPDRTLRQASDDLATVKEHVTGR
jgi:hypothetical protein